MNTATQKRFRFDGKFWLVVAGLSLICARLPVAEAQTNTSPPRTTVAVVRWLAAEPPPMAPDNQHWLLTFTKLVASELRQVAVLRVLPEEAVVRELFRLQRDEHMLDEAGRTDAVRKLGTNLHASGLIPGALAHTGAVWTAHARVVDARSGKSHERFSASSTNWFELRDQVVRHVLRQLEIVPAPEDEKRMGQVLTSSPQALDLFSQAVSDADDEPRTVELCRKALAEDPEFAEARGLLAAALYNLGRDEDSLLAAKETLSQQPSKFTAARMHLLKANVFFRNGQIAETEAEAAEGLRLCPDSAELLVLLSGLHERRGDRDAAGNCLRKASECDPGNPRIYALLGRLQAKQGDLTKALATLELAERLAVDDSSLEDVDVKVAMAQAYETTGNLPKALRHYRILLAQARDSGAPESRLKWIEETVQELERRSQPVAVLAEKPRHYSPAKLQSALRERLSPDALALAVNPIASTPEMAGWARELVADTQGDLARARRLFEALSTRPKAAGGGTRTAQEVFAAWKDLSQAFWCQEYAKLFVALARSADLPAFYVHVDRDYADRIVDHDCAVVFAEGKAWLADPAYAWFGVPHCEFRVLDDLQTIAHHAFQPHNGKADVALCRAGCELDPDFVWGRTSLVSALIRSGDFIEARKELDLVRKRAPDYWRGPQMEGFLAFKQDQYERAVEWLRQAAEANPDEAETRLLLGQALFRIGRHAEAREALLAGLRRTIQPDNDNEVIGRETLAVIEEAQGSGTNVLGASRSPVDAGAYHNLAVSMLSRENPDYDEAAKWFRKAAEMGDPQSQLVLGLLYWTGRGVPRDSDVAVGWFQKSAEGGEPQAMRNLGMAYARGLGVERNPQQALQWIRRAAEAGDAEAQAALGVALYEGVAVPKDLVEALYWLMLAAGTKADPSLVAMNDSSSFSALRMVHHSLKEVQLFASPAELAEAKSRVEKFKAKQASGSGTQKSPLISPGNTREDDVTEPK